MKQPAQPSGVHHVQLAGSWSYTQYIMNCASAFVLEVKVACMPSAAVRLHVALDVCHDVQATQLQRHACGMHTFVMCVLSAHNGSWLIGLVKL
jgi:hypothetical protein